MDIFEVIKKRHSVRQYIAKAIETEKRAILEECAKECTEESGVHFQIIYGEPDCMNSLMSKLMRFKNCTNYIVISGPKEDPELEIKAGYYGEKLVLKACEIGLGSCWIGLTHGKIDVEIPEGDKYVIMIALGYGANDGFQHKSKTLDKVSNVTENLPEWYAKGMESALLAPTAVNMQKFFFELKGEEVTLTYPKGSYTGVDAGIVKYHFEVISGHQITVQEK